MKPLVIINFKTYPEAAGDKGLALAQKIAAARKNGYEVVIAPTLLTVQEIARKIRLPIYAQHVSHAELGAYTGRVPAAELKQIGVKGTLLNHSERHVPLKFLSEIVRLCRKYRLTTVLCAGHLSEVKKIAQLHPDYIAYEPKELIGSNTSVTEAKPEIILDAVHLVKSISRRTKVLCGAGVHSKADVGHALLLGTHGVLLSHAVVKARNPVKFLEEMLS